MTDRQQMTQCTKGSTDSTVGQKLTVGGTISSSSHQWPVQQKSCDELNLSISVYTVCMGVLLFEMKG